MSGAQGGPDCRSMGADALRIKPDRCEAQPLEQERGDQSHDGRRKSIAPELRGAERARHEEPDDEVEAGVEDVGGDERYGAGSMMLLRKRACA